MPLSRLLFGNGTATAHVHAGVEVRGGSGAGQGALVVEAAIYWNAAGQLWGAGASLPATRVP